MALGLRQQLSKAGFVTALEGLVHFQQHVIGAGGVVLCPCGREQNAGRQTRNQGLQNKVG
jgi:hypothetical protein